MRTRTAGHAALAVVSALLLAGCGERAGRPADPTPQPGTTTLPPGQRQRIGVEKVAPTPFRRVVETTGTVAFDGDLATQVIAPISGPVSRLLVSLGSHVKAGDPLAAVASPDFAAAVSGFRKAEATAGNTRRIADLDEQLFKNDALARREMEQAQTDAIAAAADRDAALQQLRALGVDDASIEAVRQNRSVAAPQAMIRSPLGGVVVERLITPGQLLQAGGTPCFTVADLSTVWVMANVFESDLAYVAVGDPAEVGVAGGRPLAGTIGYVSALVDPSTRAVAVRVVTRNDGGVLRKDMYVRVTVRSRKEAVGLLVPVSALLRDDESLPFVYVENADGSFARRRVTVGTRIDDRQEVTEGLAAGDGVVVEGGLFMQFAQSQ
jgi:membrane fusion protein, heavy metal efflux system